MYTDFFIHACRFRFCTFGAINIYTYLLKNMIHAMWFCVLCERVDNYVVPCNSLLLYYFIFFYYSINRLISSVFRNIIIMYLLIYNIIFLILIRDIEIFPIHAILTTTQTRAHKHVICKWVSIVYTLFYLSWLLRNCYDYYY